MPQLRCSAEGCNEIVGYEYPASRWNPSEIEVFNEDQVDEQTGFVYCDYHWEKLQLAKQEKEEQEDD